MYSIRFERSEKKKNISFLQSKRKKERFFNETKFNQFKSAIIDATSHNSVIPTILEFFRVLFEGRKLSGCEEMSLVQGHRFNLVNLNERSR